MNQFQSVFTKDDSQDIPEVSSRVEEDIPQLKIGEDGVTKLLCSIKINKASCTAELPNQALQECATEISPAITAIFQKSVDTGELPEDWRDPNIAPVFKKGVHHVPENYRPVSLISVLSKKLEHTICHHMLNHLDENQALTSLNHGFHSGYSCETQLVVTTHDLLNFNDQNKQVDTVILDFSNAFDTVPHRKLLHKLEAYRIRGPILQWISCFLTKMPT